MHKEKGGVMKIMKVKKLVCLLCVLIAVRASACGKSGDAPITSEWEAVSWTTGGVTEYRDEGDNSGQYPRFSTADGKTFSFTITGEIEYEGTLTKQDDGTYLMKHGDNENVLTVIITGNEMEIRISEGTSIFFKVKE